MGCLRARTGRGATLFRAVTTSLPRCPRQNTEARSKAWAPALQQAGLNPGAQGRGWPGWGQEGGYRKTVHPRTGAKCHPHVCWSVCPEGNTNTGASPSRPCIQMSGVDSGLPQSAGLGCRVWEPQAGWGRVHTAWGKAPGEGAARWGAQRWMGLGWRETCVPEGSHVPWSSRHAAHLGTWKHHLVASGQNVQGKQARATVLQCPAAAPRGAPLSYPTEPRQDDLQAGELNLLVPRSCCTHPPCLRWAHPAHPGNCFQDPVFKNIRAGGERRDGIRWLDGIISSIDMSLSKLWEMVKGREVHGVTGWDTAEQLNNSV